MSWIAAPNHKRFTFHQSYINSNKLCRPFKLQAPKNQVNKKVDKKQYKPSQQTLNSTFTGIIALFNYLMGEELVLGNPAQIAKKDCKHFITELQITESQIKEPKRLTEDQWQYVLDTAIKKVDSNPLFERNVLIVASLKVLFLRISELSKKKEWSPEMKHFWQDSDNNWWLQQGKE